MQRLGTVSYKDLDWLDHAQSFVDDIGFVVVEDAFSQEDVLRLQEALFCARERILADVGSEKNAHSRLDDWRLLLKYDSEFLGLLEHPALLTVIDQLLSATCTLRFANGLIMEPWQAGTPPLPQQTFHMNWPHVTPGYRMALDIVVALTPISDTTGPVMIVPGSQQRVSAPDLEHLHKAAYSVYCPAGGMLVFDPTTWHKEVPNTSSSARLGINLQFTRSFIKPHFDYPRVLGDEQIRQLPPRVQQLLGWHTRVPTSLKEFYVPAEERLYRAGQW